MKQVRPLASTLLLLVLLCSSAHAQFRIPQLLFGGFRPLVPGLNPRPGPPTSLRPGPPTSLRPGPPTSLRPGPPTSLRPRPPQGGPAFRPLRGPPVNHLQSFRPSPQFRLLPLHPQQQQQTFQTPPPIQQQQQFQTPPPIHQRQPFQPQQQFQIQQQQQPVSSVSPIFRPSDGQQSTNDGSFGSLRPDTVLQNTNSHLLSQPVNVFSQPAQSFQQQLDQSFQQPGQSFQQPGQSFQQPDQSFQQKPGQTFIQPAQSFQLQSGQTFTSPPSFILSSFPTPQSNFIDNNIIGMTPPPLRVQPNMATTTRPFVTASSRPLPFTPPPSNSIEDLIINPVPSVNAGVLPLANELPGEVHLFPPLNRPAINQL